MFSGIIESLGTVRKVVSSDLSIEIDVDTGITDLALGESIAINGTCLTVTRFDEKGSANFFISRETLDRTSLKNLHSGQKVNLERAVSLSTRLSGHVVQGHVDATAILESVTPVGESKEIVFAVPAELRRYMVEKGSVTIDGISLTLNSVGEPRQDNFFDITLMIIPHTWEHTNLGTMKPGDIANVEVDVLAKYVENLCLYPKKN